MKLTDIVGYTYKADFYCPKCIAEVFESNQGYTFYDDLDYFKLHGEQALDYAADVLGIIRDEEATFDSDKFPKVVFRNQVRGLNPDCDPFCKHNRDVERCENCGQILREVEI